MPLEVTRFESVMAAQVARAYNRAIEGVPHCYPVSASEFAAATASTEDAHCKGRLRAQSTLVAWLGGDVVGFATAAVAPPEDGGAGERGLIRFIWYKRGHRQAGQLLFDTVEEHLLAHEVASITAFGKDFRFPVYHLRFAYLTDRMDHVHGLLGIRGYERTEQEVFLDWPELEPPNPGPCLVPVDIRCETRSGRGTRAGIVVTARQGEVDVGICDCASGGELSRHASAQDWLVTEGLWVEDHLQGQGLGRHLLLRALNEARSAGYRHAAISTEWTNHRAILFYGNIGYRAIDWTSTYQRADNDEAV